MGVQAAYGVHITQEDQLSKEILSYCKGNCRPASLDAEMSKVWQGIRSKSIKE